MRSLYLQEPPLKDLKENKEDLKHWDLRSKVNLPNDDHTHYWCRIFKAPDLNRKHHMVGLRPIIQPGKKTVLRKKNLHFWSSSRRYGRYCV